METSNPKTEMLQKLEKCINVCEELEFKRQISPFYRRTLKHAYQALILQETDRSIKLFRKYAKETIREFKDNNQDAIEGYIF